MKSQASVEFMSAVLIMILVSAIIVSAFPPNSAGDRMYYNALHSCDEFSNLIAQSLKSYGSRIRFASRFNMTINASAHLVSVFYDEDGVAFCTIPSGSVFDIHGRSEFDMPIGDYEIANSDGNLEVVPV